MKVIPKESLANYELRIIAETADENVYLSTFHNCVLSAKLTFLDLRAPEVSELLIVKEI